MPPFIGLRGPPAGGIPKYKIHINQSSNFFRYNNLKNIKQNLLKTRLSGKNLLKNLPESLGNHTVKTKN